MGTRPNLNPSPFSYFISPPAVGGGGGGYCHIWAIQVCAAVKGMVFKQFTLG